VSIVELFGGCGLVRGDGVEVGCDGEDVGGGDGVEGDVCGGEVGKEVHLVRIGFAFEVVIT